MPTPYYATEDITLHLGESLDILPAFPDASIDAVICDPPYALTELPTQLATEALTAWLTGDRAYIPAAGRGFMGREWDRFVPPPAIWDECLRVLKPGGHLLAFAAPRTADLMGLSIRLAGFEIRDSIDWIFASGMPKGKHQLKPAHEPIVVARKALAGTLAATILAHGTGGLNTDGCRINTVSAGPGTTPASRVDGRRESMAGPLDRVSYDGSASRWPTNILLSHGPNCVDGGTCQPGCPVDDMDTQSGITGSNARANKGERHGALYNKPSGAAGPRGHEDSGGASRFFPVFRYEAKAPASERPRLADGTAWPTVKPLALMQWLVRLVTPPGGTVLDWCAGTGTTLEAARLEGFPAIGVERDKDAADLTRIRLDKPYTEALFSA